MVIEKKVLYGLKQAWRMQNEEKTNYNKIHWFHSNINPINDYLKNEENKLITLLTLCVDNILITSEDISYAANQVSRNCKHQTSIDL